MLVCVHSALLKPEAISVVWVSYLAEAITAECYSDYMLLLEAMKGEEQDSSSSNNNTRNNRLSQPRGSESLAVGSRTSPTSLPTDSRLWLMQVWIWSRGKCSYIYKKALTKMVKCAFSNPLFVSDVFLDVLPPRKPRNQSAETLLNWKRCEKLQTFLMHLLILFHVLFTRIYPEGVHTSIILNWNQIPFGLFSPGLEATAWAWGEVKFRKACWMWFFFFFLSFMRESFQLARLFQKSFGFAHTFNYNSPLELIDLTHSFTLTSLSWLV